MDFLTGVYWDIGKRKINEDSLLLQNIDTGEGNMILAMVADGVGGMSEGEVASGYILEKINEAFVNKGLYLLRKKTSIRYFRRLLVKALYETSKDLERYALSKAIDMGSTLSMLILYKRQYLAISIGDSGIFRCRRKKIKKITQAHVNEDGSLNRCIGNHPLEELHIKSGFIKKNTGFLICSDGMFKKNLPDGAVLSPNDILSEDQIEKRLINHGKIVRQLGEKDNISAIYIKCF